MKISNHKHLCHLKTIRCLNIEMIVYIVLLANVVFLAIILSFKEKCAYQNQTDDEKYLYESTIKIAKNIYTSVK